MIELPKDIRDSKWLAPAHLQLLASVSELPAVDPSFEDDELKNIFLYYSLCKYISWSGTYYCPSLFYDSRNSLFGLVQAHPQQGFL